MGNKIAAVFLLLVAAVAVWVLTQIDIEVCEQFFASVYAGIKEAYVGYGLYLNNQ